MGFHFLTPGKQRGLLPQEARWALCLTPEMPGPCCCIFTPPLSCLIKSPVPFIYSFPNGVEPSLRLCLRIGIVPIGFHSSERRRLQEVTNSRLTFVLFSDGFFFPLSRNKMVATTGDLFRLRRMGVCWWQTLAPLRVPW